MIMGDCRNVCFHGIGAPRRELEAGEEPFWISRDEYHAVLDEVAGWPNAQLSFDDGNITDLEIGLEGLRERGLTGTFFVLGGRLEEKGSLNSADLRELVKSGMTIGTHGMDHRSWRGLTESERVREFVDAREAISEASGARVQEASAPLGEYDRNVLGELRRVGYAKVHTSDGRIVSRDSWLQPRFSVRGGEALPRLRREIKDAELMRTRIKLAAKGIAKRLR